MGGMTAPGRSAVPTIATVLAGRARTHADKFFVRFREADFTYADFDRHVRSLASGIRAHGIGGVIPTLLPNCADAIALWFAANRAGAIWAPLNTGFRGIGLAHAVNLTGSRDLIVDRSLVDPLLGAADDLEHVERLFVRGLDAETSDALAQSDRRFTVLPFDAVLCADDGAPPHSPSSPADPSLLIYTSGTTGASKACELSHRYALGQAAQLAWAARVRADDVIFCPYPVFHWDATIGTVGPALYLGATAVITERFSVSRFWADVRHYGVTVFDFMGATLTFIYNQDPREDDADNPARLGWGVPMPAFQTDFERRFGVRLVEGYGSTELGVIVFHDLDDTRPPPPGSCGRCLPEFRLRIVDDDGRPLPPGSVGEIAARPAAAEDRYLMMTGYYQMPEANREAFRDGWFHTGDLGRLDEAGNLYFEGRKKDAIRRRGENISAFEIEQVIESHPAVVEAAAYGVPSEFTEEDVALAVVVRDGHELGADEILEYCRGRMARYMVPDHVRFLDALPKTPTEKVSKRLLRDWHVPPAGSNR
ncbi:MAG: ATP-dependent acyl-CoA ligase [Gemmatimonadetes bacterium]|nr:ATP-dependent acyl-CoA ligase [Gemmatimonadota bacterium]MYE93702.1 ATP-dependent acyl-CoA ligase [Gemmatimonadota bacterium]MYJ12306.1 ATP-dependent acyl-CoA ligase [Gemmatimonadota bacterium]